LRTEATFWQSPAALRVATTFGRSPSQRPATLSANQRAKGHTKFSPERHAQPAKQHRHYHAYSPFAVCAPRKKIPFTMKDMVTLDLAIGDNNVKERIH
jgi:hypothetical protein